MIRKSAGLAALAYLAFSLPVFAAETVLNDNDLLSLAANKYASGELPLGDNRYVTDAPKKGYIYLCHLMQDRGGAQVNGPWIHGATWNIFAKIAVQGKVNWSNARFSTNVEGDTRTLTGNGLPLDHPTGIFPVQPSDPAYLYDRNPNSIAAQTEDDALPVDPLYSDTPFCMGGEVGIMLTGVPLFNGFDAGMRDAAAHEVQDACQGHPQSSGQYHYHSLSSCIKDVGEKTVIGYALDGFPITGPMVAAGRYLTTDDLDICHGITSEIIGEDGQKKVTYHYVMTQDFPYSVSCFRAKPIRTGPSHQSGPQRQPSGMMQSGMQSGTTPPQTGPQQGQRPPPPQEAFVACNGKNDGAVCSFTSPRGNTVSGACHMPPLQNTLVCVPARMP